MSIKQVLASHPELQLKNALSEAELREFAHGLPGPLPPDVEELLRYAAGFRSELMGDVDYTGRLHRFEFKEIIPHGLALAKTMEGNYWVIDIHGSGNWDKVFFWCHDPPTVGIQFDSLRTFTEAAVRGNKIEEDADILTTEIWKDFGSGLMVTDARKSSDTKVAEFARSLPDNFRVFDLRPPTGIKGFAWGRDGPYVECKRFNDELIFAVEVKEPRKGFFSRWFG